MNKVICFVLHTKNNKIRNGTSLRLCVFCAACAQVSIIHELIGPDDVYVHLNPLVEAKSVIQGIAGKKAAAKSRLVSLEVRNEESCHLWLKSVSFHTSYTVNV